MRNAARTLLVAAGAVAVVGCHKQQSATQNDDLSLESNMPGSEVPPNAEIETLPADESSATSNSDLAAGEVHTDINAAGNEPQPH